MSELTEVELLWLENRIENRIRFGKPVEERVVDFTGASFRSGPAASSHTSDGHRMTSGRCYLALTLCVPSNRVSPTRRYLGSAPVQRAFCGFPAGPRSSAHCN